MLFAPCVLLVHVALHGSQLHGLFARVTSPYATTLDIYPVEQQES